MRARGHGKDSIEDKKKVVFVCTGNVFRSLSAEFAARATHQQGAPDVKFAFESAGTRGRAAKRLHPNVIERTMHWNMDTTTHVSRPLTQDIVDEADLLIAMDRSHQQFIRKNFGLSVPLYLQIAEGRAEDLQDVNFVVDDFKNKPEETRSYIYGVVDRIVANQERFLKNLPSFIKSL